MVSVSAKFVLESSMYTPRGTMLFRRETSDGDNSPRVKTRSAPATGDPLSKAELDTASVEVLPSLRETKFNPGAGAPLNPTLSAKVELVISTLVEATHRTAPKSEMFRVKTQWSMTAEPLLLMLMAAPSSEMLPSNTER